MFKMGPIWKINRIKIKNLRKGSLSSDPEVYGKKIEKKFG